MSPLPSRNAYENARNREDELLAARSADTSISMSTVPRTSMRVHLFRPSHLETHKLLRPPARSGSTVTLSHRTAAPLQRPAPGITAGTPHTSRDFISAINPDTEATICGSLPREAPQLVIGDVAP